MMRLRTTKRTVAIPALLALLAGLPALDAPVASADPEAVHPANRPTPVEGEENGKLPPERLIGVAPGCEALREAASSLGLLVASARNHGVDLRTRECYRPLNEQVAVRQRWTDRGNRACAAPVQRDPNGEPVGTSNHGWGKAVDLADANGSLRFSSGAFSFLTRKAAPYGWNHPDWAARRDAACPEPWHWEWVGDGGRMGAPPVRADVVGMMAAPRGDGYSTVTGLGDVRHHGRATDHGSAAQTPIPWLVAAGARTPSGGGYWLAGGDGRVYVFGDARHAGSAEELGLEAPIVGVAATPDGGGYWLAAADGGVFAFGGAVFHGSTGSLRLNRPIVAMAPTPDGGGYWLIASDGGVFAFGNARFQGSTGALRLNSPVVGAAATAAGDGYWLVAEDGGVFAFGGARFAGSMGDRPLNAPVTGLASTPDGVGYWLVAADGGIFSFGRARFHGAG